MSPTTRSKRFISPRFALPLAAVVVLLSIFAVYYLVVIKRQEALADDRAFRSLAVINAQFRDVVSTYSIVLAGAAQEDSRQQKHKRTGTATAGPSSHVLNFLATEAPQLADVDNCAFSPDAEVLKAEASAADAAVSATAVPRSNGYNLQLASNGTCAYVAFENLVPPLITEVPSQIFDDIILADASGRVLYQTQRSGIVADNLSHLTLTSDQAGTAGAGTTLGQASNDGQNSASTTVQLRHSATQPPSAEKSSSPFSGATELSRVFRVTLAGADYRIYLVPVRLSVPRPSASGTIAGERFVLCGLMLQRHFATQSRSVPLTVLTAITLAVVLVIVSAWPVLKFLTMRRSEEITRWAGPLYAVSSTLAVMIAILLVIHLYYGFADPKTNNNMEDLAKAIDVNVGQELSQALRVMDSVGSTSRVKNAKAIEHDPRPCGSATDGKVPAAETDLLSRVGMEVSDYPYFRRLFVYDSQGFEHARWTVDAEAPPGLRVCDRPYFKGVQRNDLWYLTAQGLSGARFRVDPIYSKSTGEYLAFIARPFKIERTGKAADAGVMTMITSMLALIRPVLPPDYAFAVIDPTGGVLFHSDATKNGRENFFDQLEDSRQLRAAVLAGRKSWQRESYMGEDYGVFVTPFTTIQGCPWSLLVLSNRTVLGDKELERTVLLGLLCLMYLIVLVAAIAFLLLFLPCNRLAWPTEPMRGSYYHIALVLGLVTILAYAFIFEASPKELLSFAVLIPASAIGFSILGLKRYRLPITVVAGLLGSAALLKVAVAEASENGSWRASPYLTLALICAAYLSLGSETLTDLLSKWKAPSLATAYSLGCYALLVLAAGIPCVAFFKIAYDYDENLAVRRQQLLTISALNRREERVIGEYLQVKISGANVPFGEDLGKWLFLRRRLQEQKLDLYDKAFRDQRAGQIIGDRDISEWPHWWVSLAALLASQRSELLTSLVADNCPERSKWCWSESGANGLRMQPQQGSRGLEEVEGSPETLALRKLAIQDPIFLSQDLSYHIDVLKPWDFLRLIAVALFALLAAIFFSVRSTMTRMFLLNWNFQDAWDSATLAQAAVQSDHCILLGLPTSGKTAWLNDNAARVGTIDVALALASKPTTAPAIPEQTVVALDHFEYGLDHELKRWKLVLLQDLLKAGKTILIVTTVDPLFSSADAAQDSADNLTEPHASPCDAANWTRILARFKILRLAGGSPPTSREYYNQVLWSTFTSDEKIALHSLAAGDWSNYKNYAALQHLWKRGLIAASPELHLTDSEFGEFVAGKVSEPERRSWRLGETTSLWDGLRTTLIVLLLGGLAALLFFTQKDILGIVTGAIGALTAATKIISEFKGGGTSGGKGGPQAV